MGRFFVVLIDKILNFLLLKLESKIKFCGCWKSDQCGGGTTNNYWIFLKFVKMPGLDESFIFTLTNHFNFISLFIWTWHKFLGRFSFVVLNNKLLKFCNVSIFSNLMFNLDRRTKPMGDVQESRHNLIISITNLSQLPSHSLFSSESTAR